MTWKEALRKMYLRGLCDVTGRKHGTGQTRVSDPLDLELLVVITSVGAGTQHVFSVKTVNALQR